MSLIYKKRRRTPALKTRRRTRADHKNNFEMPTPRLSLYKKGPSYRGRQLWNKLPHGIQTAETKAIFKAKIKKWYNTDMKGKREALLKRRRKRKPP